MLNLKIYKILFSPSEFIYLSIFLYTFFDRHKYFLLSVCSAFNSLCLDINQYFTFDIQI